MAVEWIVSFEMNAVIVIGGVIHNCIVATVNWNISFETTVVAITGGTIHDCIAMIVD